MTRLFQGIGFGTYRFLDNTAIKATKNALENGYKIIDTAYVYGNEKDVGIAIKESKIKRDEIFITSKVWRDELKYADLIKSAKRSLKNLNLDYLDLLLIHWPNENIDLKESIDALLELKKRKLIKNIGVSNFNISLLKQALKYSNGQILTNQIEMHAFLNSKKMRKFALANNIKLTAYIPLAQGLIANSDELEPFAKKYKATKAQIALSFLLHLGALPIPASKSVSHQQENLKAKDIKLSQEDIKKILSFEQKRIVTPDYQPLWDD